MSAFRRLFFCVIALTAGCSPVLLNRTDFENEESEYREIVSIYDAGAYETALKWLKSHEDRGARGKRWPYLLQLRGLVYMALHRPALASSEFERALSANTSGQRELEQEILHHLAWAHFEMGRVSRAMEIARSVRLESLDGRLQINHRILKARIYLQREIWSDAALESLVTAREAPSSGRILSPILEESLKHLDSIDAIRPLLKDFPETSISDYLIYRCAQLEIAAGRDSEGRGLLRTLISRFPDSRFYSVALRQLKARNLDVPSEATKIGVLLPTTGKLAGAGDQVLRAIQMGIKTSSRLRNAIHLVVEDTGESPSDALAALDRLIYEHHVLAILGPMTSKGLDLVAQRAQELGVPLISLSRRDAPPGDFVFQGSLTLKQQIESLAKFEILKRGKKRFALLYPQDRLGEIAAEYFWSAVDELGGEVRAVSSYRSDETDFKSAVDALTGTASLEARSREAVQIQKSARPSKMASRKRRADENRIELPPVVDFDAVFIPDELKAAGQILPMFAYRDLDSVDFLGTSLWNSEQIGQRLGKFADKKVYFVDVFSTHDQSPGVTAKFFEQFRALHGTLPGPMEAVSFDAAAVIANAVARMEGSNSRERLRRLLLETEDLPGVTGVIRVRHPVLSRPLKVFSFRNGQISLAEQLQ